jgi:hypothetical protein
MARVGILRSIPSFALHHFAPQTHGAEGRINGHSEHPVPNAEQVLEGILRVPKRIYPARAGRLEQTLAFCAQVKAVFGYNSMSWQPRGIQNNAAKDGEIRPQGGYHQNLPNSPPFDRLK